MGQRTHVGFRIGLPVIAAVMTMLMSMIAPAEARHVASIVIDAGSGKVLEAHDADELHYPASLTKLMTLYLVFEALHAHRLTLAHQFRVSRHAASREPTKLGLHPGERISVRNLILGLVTESANDAASVLAEGLAGSESAFAARMTRKAQALGMRHTVFRNASGLPDRRQVTTARDMARLARAILRDFPEDYRYFSVRKFRYKGRTYFNHDHLIFHYAGADGMKTGFTQAAGFNLVTSAQRKGRRLIGVVLGDTSHRRRDRRMARLLDRGFARLAPAIEVADASAGGSHITDRAEQLVAALSPVSRADARPYDPPKAAAAHRPRPKLRSWSIQVGAFAHRRPAVRLARKVARAHVGVGPRNRRIVPRRRKSGGSLYRLRFVGLRRQDAAAACRALHRRHYECFVVASSE